MNRIDTDDLVRLEPLRAADSTVILLHGLGADGDDLVPMAGELRLPPDRSTRFLLPHAPMRSMALAPGPRIRAWYDVLGFDRRSVQDEAGIRQSAASVEKIIADQCASGMPAGRIVLAGFSQGAAMALHVALRYPQRLGGLLVMSGYLPLEAVFSAEASPANRELPILMFHGEQDPTLPVELGRLSRDTLRDAGYAVDWHSYPAMGHSICAEEIDVISGWLGYVLT